MEKTIYLNNLFDIYGELFTLKQQNYFKDYYFDNLSYGEISEKYGITRNAIFKQLKNMEQKLLFYEEKLKIYDKKIKINDILIMLDNKKIKNMIKDLL